MKKTVQTINIVPEQELSESRKIELESTDIHSIPETRKTLRQPYLSIYDHSDGEVLLGTNINPSPVAELQTLDDLMEKDKLREADGFPRRIRIGRLVKPGKGPQKNIIVVPTTTEPKFYHDDRISEDEEDSTGGTGDEKEGEVIGEESAKPEQGEGEGSGAGQGQGGKHEVGTDAFDLGKVLTERFTLPNLKDKGKKRSITKYTYDLTDLHRGYGQILDKKATLKRVLETNILLGRISEDETDSFGAPIQHEELLINPQDNIYRILSSEKDFENQAVVFFVRDYSGSMQGKPTETIATLHLFIYSWLVYQFKMGNASNPSNVMARFILHDTEAKEVPDFYTYFKSNVAGGTNIYPAYRLVNEIIEKEHLVRDNNIYIFHGTDGDDWEEDGKQMLEELRKMLSFANRIGITVARNTWGATTQSVVEKNLEYSGLLKERHDLLRLDTMVADSATEERIIDGIKYLIG
ncbi:MAG: superfamily protein [Ignavibacteria bacterium]|nr:superfamily protein [Ignavibacteria bacterium]